MWKRFFEKWKKKSWFAKLTDILFIALIITLLFPQGRMAVGGTMNRIKSMVSQPDLMENSINTNDVAFDWEIVSVDNQSLILSELKGKVIFLNLWATWCPPCVGEMPGIQTLYDNFKDDPGVAFVLVSNEPVETIKNFMDRKGYTFPVYSSRSATPPAFSTRSIPTTYLLDKNGDIVMKEIGAMNWGGSKMEKIIDDLLRVN